MIFCGQNKIISQTSISGAVWHDLNVDGLQGVEPYMQGFTVELYNLANVIQGTQVTSALGTYSFNSLPAGIYYVKFLINSPDIFTPSGFGTDTTNCDVTGANGVGTTDTLVLSGNNTINNIDAGYFHYVKLGDLVWEDMNGNGLQDVGEPGVSGVIVSIVRTSNNTV